MLWRSWFHDKISADRVVYIHIPTREYQNIDPIIGGNNLFESVVVTGGSSILQGMTNLVLCKTQWSPHMSEVGLKTTPQESYGNTSLNKSRIRK